MAEATNQQVQQWADQRTRVRAEQIRALLLAMESDNSTIGDVYENLTTSPNWTDGRTDGPPHLLEPTDLLAVNTVCQQLAKILRGGPFANDAERISAVNDVGNQLAIVLEACVRA
jgi:hypothetical protein